MPTSLGTPAKSRVLKPAHGNAIHHEFLVNKKKTVLTYDADFVASNSIAASVQGVSITPVVYASSHTATLAALATAIEGLANVESADVTGAREITIIAEDQTTNVLVTSTVTGGSSQPVATAVNHSQVIKEGQQVKLTTSGKIEPLGASDTKESAIGHSIQDGSSDTYLTIATKFSHLIMATAAGSQNAGFVKFNAQGTDYPEYAAANSSTYHGYALDSANTQGDEIMVGLV